jgi:hypothetical protein
MHPFFPNFVIARAKPLAIHWSSVNEPQFLYAFIACSGLPRRSLACPPRNDNIVFTTIPSPHLVIASPLRAWRSTGLSKRTAVSVRVHCMQWIAASVPCVPPRNDNIVFTTIPSPHLVIARAESPWRTPCSKKQTAYSNSPHHYSFDNPPKYLV